MKNNKTRGGSPQAAEGAGIPKEAVSRLRRFPSRQQEPEMSRQILTSPFLDRTHDRLTAYYHITKKQVDKPPFSCSSCEFFVS